jgi:hypothetical protein
MVTAAAANDITELGLLLDTIRTVRGRLRRPHRPPDTLQGDRGYDSQARRDQPWP